MGIVSPGFSGHRRSKDKLPPGQYLVHDFPVLSALPDHALRAALWDFTITTESGAGASPWDWVTFQALPAEDVTVDLHCVTKWSKLGTPWRGVSLDTLMALALRPRRRTRSPVPSATTRPTCRWRTSLDGKAWIAFPLRRPADLEREHGGPARLLVPHLYLWKSREVGPRHRAAPTMTSPASGKASATTTTETHGASSGTGATDLAAPAPSAVWTPGSSSTSRDHQRPASSASSAGRPDSLKAPPACSSSRAWGTSRSGPSGSDPAEVRHDRHVDRRQQHRRGPARRVQRRYDRGHRPLRRMREHRPARRGPRLQPFPGTGPALPSLREKRSCAWPAPPAAPGSTYADLSTSSSQLPSSRQPGGRRFSWSCAWTSVRAPTRDNVRRSRRPGLPITRRIRTIREPPLNPGTRRRRPPGRRGPARCRSASREPPARGDEATRSGR